MFRVPPVVFTLLLSLSSFSAFAQFADLRVSLTAPESTRPGQQVTFTGTVENFGPDAAADVRVTLYGALTGCHDGTFIGTLQRGQKRSFDCTIPTPPSPPWYSIPVSINVWTTTHDPDTFNNGMERRITIITPPDLFIFTNNQGVIVPALPFTITIRYGNRTSFPATSGIVTITSPTPITRAPGFCTIAGTRAVCAVGTVTTFVDFDVEIVAPDVSDVPVPVVLEIAANEAEHAPDDNRFITRLATFATFFATSTNDSGSGSLRAAIEEANATCTDARRLCLIAFRIPGTGSSGSSGSPEGRAIPPRNSEEPPRNSEELPSHTIAPLSPLPAITAWNMQVDGGTQRRFFGNTVGIRGDGLEAGNGLELMARCENIVRDLTIEGFPGNGISVYDATCDASHQRRLERNVLRRNGRGISIQRRGFSVTENVIRDNVRAGVFLARGQAFVGTNTIQHNGASGIFVSAEASGTDIRKNTIAHNAHFGVGIAREATNVSVNENLIYANRETPIDYGLDGLSTVEPVPPPVITSVYFQNGETIIEATTTALGTFSPIVEIYANDYPHPRGFGEGQHYLGQAEGLYPERIWRLRVPHDLRGKWIAATATRVIYIGWSRNPRAEGDTGDFFTTTSEFSVARRVD